MRRLVSTRKVAALLATAVAASTVVAGIDSAGAAVTAGGGTNEEGVPVYLRDSRGLAVSLCTDDLLCEPASGLDIGQYFGAEAEVGPLSASWAIEAAINDHLADEPPMVSNSVAFRARGLRPNRRYTIRGPWGAHSCLSDGRGALSAKNCSFERGGESGGPIRLGPVKSLLRTHLPLRGFLGSDAPQRVTGSPTGYNRVTFTGPGASYSTNRFTVTGQLAADMPMSLVDASALRLVVRGARPVTEVIRYRSVGTAPAVPRIHRAGTDPGAFRVATNCASVTPGSACTIAVTFRPVAGRKSAVLVIDDNTLAQPRRVALSGIVR